MGHRAVLGMVMRRKISSPRRESNAAVQFRIILFSCSLYGNLDSAVLFILCGCENWVLTVRVVQSLSKREEVASYWRKLICTLRITFLIL
jgi:hypothetical protein